MPWNTAAANEPSWPIHDPWHYGATMESVADISRTEFEAKLEASEARAQTAIARIEGKLDVLLTKTQYASEQASSLKWWIAGLIATVIVSAVGTVVGIAGANTSLVQSVIGAFQAGQDTPKQSTSAKK